MTHQPILLILGCQKYRASLMAAIERMKHPSYYVIGLVGGVTEITFDGTLLSLPVEDSYEFLPKKVQAAFRWIHSTFPDTPGIFKTDEDIFFRDQNQLASEIVQKAHIPYWGIAVHHCGAGNVDLGRIQKGDNHSIRPSHPAAHYSFGHGYWVSRVAIPIVCASNEYEGAFLEDVCMGHVLNKHGWRPLNVRIPYEERPRS
jgi:hypothetical protein